MNPARLSGGFVARFGRVCALAASVSASSSGCARKLLLAEDVVLPQGESEELAAAVDEQALVIFTKGVPNTPVEFFLNDQRVSQSTTDKEGRASAESIQVPSVSTYKA